MNTKIISVHILFIDNHIDKRLSYLSEPVWENLVHMRRTGISVIKPVAWSPSYSHSAYIQWIELKCISLLVSILAGADVYPTKSDINGTYEAHV